MMRWAKTKGNTTRLAIGT